MQSKSSRGIQSEDVWGAADALIAEGLRPTIERVRQRIGRGSPNTVSPMLEAWFATLASRLGVNTPNDDVAHIPKAVQQAMENLWGMALSNGKEQADQKIAQAQFDLTEARDALRARERELVQHQQVLTVKHEALEDALRSAVNRAEDLMSRLGQEQALTKRREVEIGSLREKLATIENERNAYRLRMEEEGARNIKERQRHEERTDATQRKLLEEIDRARQETKKMRIEVQISEKRFDTERSSLQQKILSCETDLSTAQELSSAHTADLNSLREALAASNIRSNELLNLLEKHQRASEATITSLTGALSIQKGHDKAVKKRLVRKVKRPIRI